MKDVAQILKSKADHKVYTVSPLAPVLDAVKLMAEKNLGALLVLDGEEFVGIISERDCTRKMLLADRLPRETPVRDIMSSPVQYVSPGHTNEECMALMTDKRLRHLPVIDNGKLIGLVSIGDLVKDIISEQSFIIQQLEHYIAGVKG
ncbi:CBS domain-containing protein [Polaromonas sp. P1(28)-8]|nr:CBS domain-containing protein [Polaromonas sp. P1(28)-8]